MTDTINEKDGQNGKTGQEPAKPERSEERFKDLTEKLSEKDKIIAMKDEERAKEKAELEQKLKESEFKASLSELSATFPKAKDFEKEIREYSDKGLSVEDATQLVLSKKGEYKTSEDIHKSNTDSNSFGGVSVNANPSPKDFSKMSLEEKRAELQKREQDGAWGFNGREIFVKE